MSKSFIRYEFAPSERLILLRGIYLLLSNIMEDMYFFGFYDDEFEMDDQQLADKREIDNKENAEPEEESNFFEENTAYDDNFEEGPDEDSEEEEEDGDDESYVDFDDDDFDDDDDVDDFDDDWTNERQEMERMIGEIKVLENKLLNYKSYDKSPELGINELELLLHSAHEVKHSLEDDPDETLELDDDPDIAAMEQNLADAINNMPDDTKKQLEEDYDNYLYGQHRELSALIDKINDWIDNYQINSN